MHSPRVRMSNSLPTYILTYFLVLVGLYEEPERPPNAVDYIKRYMGAPTGVDVEALKAENSRLKAENEEMRAQVEAAQASAVSLYFDMQDFSHFHLGGQG